MLQIAFCEWFGKCVYVAAVVPILFRVRLSAICEFVGNNAALPHAFVFLLAIVLRCFSFFAPTFFAVACCRYSSNSNATSCPVLDLQRSFCKFRSVYQIWQVNLQSGSASIFFLVFFWNLLLTLSNIAYSYNTMPNIIPV